MSYTLQLYFDFSGYCDMAIGLALLFNIKLPLNFYSPYKARNIQEFWKRWHMTLGRFLTQYLYIPLGGNRKGYVRTLFNVFIVFLISGIWHGAGWTFVIWGIMHGVASIIVRLWSSLKIKLPYIISWFITFLFVNTAWVYFRADTISQANSIVKKMYNFDYSYNYPLKEFFNKPLLIFEEGQDYNFVLFTLDNPKIIVFSIIILLLVSFLAKNSIQLIENFKTNYTTILYAQGLIFIILISVFFVTKNSEFLYFNF